MTLTPWDFALASIAAPEPESRLTSRSTLAPLVIACSACCCWVDLSPSAFWIVDSTPAASNAFLRNGRSTVSHRTDDLVSGSSTATLPGLPPPELLLDPPPPPPLSLPQPAVTASAPVAATAAIRHATEGTAISSSWWIWTSIREAGSGRPRRPRARPRRAPAHDRRARPRPGARRPRRRATPRGRSTRARRRAAGHPPGP